LNPEGEIKYEKYPNIVGDVAGRSFNVYDWLRLGGHFCSTKGVGEPQYGGSGY